MLDIIIIKGREFLVIKVDTYKKRNVMTPSFFPRNKSYRCKVNEGDGSYIEKAPTCDDVGKSWFCC